MFELMNYITPVYTGKNLDIKPIDIYKPNITLPSYFPNQNTANFALLDDFN